MTKLDKLKAQIADIQKQIDQMEGEWPGISERLGAKKNELCKRKLTDWLELEEELKALNEKVA